MCGVLCPPSNSKLNEDIDIGPFASLFIGFGGVPKKYERFLRIDFGTLELGARLVVWFWGSFSGEITLRWRIFSNFWSISGRSRIFLAHLQYYLGQTFHFSILVSIFENRISIQNWIFDFEIPKSDIRFWQNRISDFGEKLWSCIQFYYVC